MSKNILNMLLGGAICTPFCLQYACKFNLGEIETKSEARLSELGENKGNIKEVSAAVAKKVFSGRLTSAEAALISNSEYANQVVEELSADNANTIWKGTIKSGSGNNLNLTADFNDAQGIGANADGGISKVADGEQVKAVPVLQTSEKPSVSYDTKGASVDNASELNVVNSAGQLEKSEKSGIIKVGDVDVQPSRVVVEGKDLSAKIDYENSEFDYDIKTALHAQGYDGLPQVVERDEFEEAMNESQFYAERTYSGATPDEANVFQDMLYNGEFYVECSTGGAQYGQGMYCASCYDLTDSDSLRGIGIEMQHYQDLNRQRGRSYAITEGITLQPDCKVFELPYGVKTDEYIPRIYRNNYLKTHASKELLPTIEKFIEVDDQIEKMYLGKTDRDTLDKLYALSDDLRGQIPKALFDESDEAMKYYPKGFEKWGKYKNSGTLVAEMGYDLIKATGHGQSGSYTVVLNRTKLIFCKGGSIYGN